MVEVPKRTVIYLGIEQQLPASLAERMVKRGDARYSETTSRPERATSEAPERAVKPAPRRRTARKGKSSK